MKELEILQYYRKLLNKETLSDAEKYSCLLYALTLPDVCAKLEFPELYKEYECIGKSYAHWLEIHLIDMTFECPEMSDANNKVYEALYKLRNNMVHDAVALSKSVFFISEHKNPMVVGKMIFIPVIRFCNAIFSAAEKALVQHKESCTASIGIEISDEKYDKLRNEVYQSCEKYWKQHKEENKLVIVYEALCFCNYDGVKKVGVCNFLGG